MHFIVKVFSEIIIKSPPVRKRFIKQLRDSLRLIFIVLSLTVLAGCGGGGSSVGSSPAPVVVSSSLSSSDSSSLSSSNSSSRLSSSSRSSVLTSTSSSSFQFDMTLFNPKVPEGLWRAPSNAIPATGGYAYFQDGATSDNGKVWLYTTSNAEFIVIAYDNAFTAITINGNERLLLDFVGTQTGKMQVGYYGNIGKDLNDRSRGNVKLDGCGIVNGWFAVDEIAYDNTGTLTSIDLRFEYYCEGRAAHFHHGQIHWSTTDMTTPPGPIDPPPPNLWQPPPAATPDSGNYVYLESEPNDWVGKGGTYLYTQRDAKISVQAVRPDTSVISIFGLAHPYLAVSVEGDINWSGNFTGMSFMEQVQKGYYGELDTNISKGGIGWAGGSSSCNFGEPDFVTYKSWFVIDDIKYDGGGNLQSVDLRFEQHCELSPAALHGKIHWSVNDPTLPPGPVAPPFTLWRAPADKVPAQGDYAYFEAGLTGGSPVRSVLNTKSDADFFVNDLHRSANPGGAYLSAIINGDSHWDVEFIGMDFLTRIQPGYYGGLQRYPFYNAVKGGLHFGEFGESECDHTTGWVAVDDVDYDADGNLLLVNFRFEVECIFIWHGEIHWSASDKSKPPAPINPPPANLWAPTATLPVAGNYIYLKSDADDYVGSGKTMLFKDDGVEKINVKTQFDVDTGQFLELDTTVEHIGGTDVHSRLLGMSFMNYLLQPGYYGSVGRANVGNPVRGGMDWGVQGHGCNTLTGWFVIDNISYDLFGVATALDVRFEQHCEGDEAALRGKLHWVK